MGEGLEEQIKVNPLRILLSLAGGDGCGNNKFKLQNLGEPHKVTRTGYFDRRVFEELWAWKGRISPAQYCNMLVHIARKTPYDREHRRTLIATCLLNHNGYGGLGEFWREAAKHYRF
jgi:hypothetical protein